jgi:hypothetical protein
MAFSKSFSFYWTIYMGLAILKCLQMAKQLEIYHESKNMFPHHVAKLSTFD